MNAYGDIVGVSTATPIPAGADPSCCWRAFVYQHSSGATNQLSYGPADQNASANGINDNGEVAGTVDATTGPQAILWAMTGGAQQLSPDIMSMGQGLNNAGVVIGGVNNGHQGNLAVMWNPEHSMTSLGTLDQSDPHHIIYAPESYASSINGGNQIVGGSDTVVSGPDNNPVATFHASLWQSGQMTDIGTLPGADQSTANGVNSAGDIVGSAGMASCLVASCPNSPSHAFLYHQGSMLDLGNLANDPDLSSVANAINDSGEIVGWSEVRLAADNAIASRAFLYTGGTLYNLTFLIDPTSPLYGFVKLTDAVAINCNGWIAANGLDTRDTYRHAYLLIRQGSPRSCG